MPALARALVLANRNGSDRARAIFDLRSHAKENIDLSCSTIAIIGGIIVALVLWVCSRSAISKYERAEQKYRRWRQKQDREQGAPPDDE